MDDQDVQGSQDKVNLDVFRSLNSQGNCTRGSYETKRLCRFQVQPYDYGTVGSETRLCSSKRFKFGVEVGNHLQHHFDWKSNLVQHKQLVTWEVE